MSVEMLEAPRLRESFGSRDEAVAEVRRRLTNPAFKEYTSVMQASVGGRFVVISIPIETLAEMIVNGESFNMPQMGLGPLGARGRLRASW